jgi:hypothetical protein
LPVRFAIEGETMKLEQSIWTKEKGWTPLMPRSLRDSAQLVLIFGARPELKEKERFEEIRQAYPSAHCFGCSTAGEICETSVCEDSVVITAVNFEHSYFRGTKIRLSDVQDSFEAGERIAKSLNTSGLVHVFVLSDGLGVNGSALVKGLTQNLPDSVKVTGGLAGDGERFKETLVFYDDEPQKDTIVAIGLYGDRLKVGHGSLGGWDPFGPERLITKSKGNILYELDGKSALELYKKYLGEHAQGLPATGLLFPLSLRTKEGETGVVRTILSVDETRQSMTFAGDIPEGAYAQLMKANFDRLIDGAVGAAKTSFTTIGSFSPDLAILISCVGRKLVLQQRTEEEVEGVRDVLGEHTVFTGFYSYGEISPFNPGTRCELHNQTMTITVFSEK